MNYGILEGLWGRPLQNQTMKGEFSLPTSTHFPVFSLFPQFQLLENLRKLAILAHPDIGNSIFEVHVVFFLVRLGKLF